MGSENVYKRQTPYRPLTAFVPISPLTDWDGNELLLSDILGTEEDVIYQGLEQEAEHRVLGSAISKLSEREQVIVKLRFGINMPEGREKTQKEVADLLGISQSYISRLEKRIMKRLRKEIARYE